MSIGQPRQRVATELKSQRHSDEEFVHIKMIMDRKYGLNYLFPFRGVSQALIANELPEDLNFAFHADPY